MVVWNWMEVMLTRVLRVLVDSLVLVCIDLGK
jgi:hypothetical protein